MCVGFFEKDLQYTKIDDEYFVYRLINDVVMINGFLRLHFSLMIGIF